MGGYKKRGTLHEVPQLSFALCWMLFCRPPHLPTPWVVQRVKLSVFDEFLGSGKVKREPCGSGPKHHSPTWTVKTETSPGRGIKTPGVSCPLTPNWGQRIQAEQRWWHGGGAQRWGEHVTCRKQGTMKGCLRTSKPLHNHGL